MYTPKWGDTLTRNPILTSIQYFASLTLRLIVKFHIYVTLANTNSPHLNA